MGNKGAFVRFNSDCKPEYTQFSAVSHPAIRPMAYASNAFGMGGVRALIIYVHMYRFLEHMVLILLWYYFTDYAIWLNTHTQFGGM